MTPVVQGAWSTTERNQVLWRRGSSQGGDRDLVGPESKEVLKKTKKVGGGGLVTLTRVLTERSSRWSKLGQKSK